MDNVIKGPGVSSTITTPTGTYEDYFISLADVKKWFTNVQLVRRLVGSGTGGTKVFNEEQILSGTAENFLKNANLEVSTDVVKKLTDVLGPDLITVSDYNWNNLENSKVFESTLDVYNQTDESFKLTEGTDFIVDYERGRIRLVRPVGVVYGASSSGSVGDEEFLIQFGCNFGVVKKYQIHYQYFVVTTRTVDYSIDYLRGKIARIVGGSIQSGDKVYIDYEILESVTDQLIEDAINMSHVQIICEIGESYEGSLDEKLKYAESYLAAYHLSSLVQGVVISEALAGSPYIHQIARNLKIIEESNYRKYRTFLNSGGYVNIGFPLGISIKQNEG